MIPGLHNSIYFWALVVILYVGFGFEQPKQILVMINPTQAQIYKDHNPVDYDEVIIMCWNELTQTPKECKK